MYAGSYQRIVGGYASVSSRSERSLARMAMLHPKEIDLSLQRLERLLADLDHPEQKLPPVIHVAGTNGKGSTIAFLQAILESGGARIHAYTSPHLITFKERIRLASGPGVSSSITEAHLARCLARVERANAKRPITFFEITTAAALLAFSETAADVVLLETGLGGRLDATNVIGAPLATVITSISLDHTALLGSTLAAIAKEKAGILKPGSPCIVAPQAPEALAVIAERAQEIDAPLVRFGFEFDASKQNDALVYSSARRHLMLPLPTLRGQHQIVNAGMAIAAVDTGYPTLLDPCHLSHGIQNTRWDGRLQMLGAGNLRACVDPDTEIIVDGAHNPGGAEALVEILDDVARGRPVHMICGMIESKNALGILGQFTGRVDRLYTVPIEGRRDAIHPDTLAAIAGNSGFVVQSARGIIHALLMSRAAMHGPGLVLICGSLYLVGCTLEIHNGS